MASKYLTDDVADGQMFTFSRTFVIDSGENLVFIADTRGMDGIGFLEFQLSGDAITSMRLSRAGLGGGIDAANGGHLAGVAKTWKTGIDFNTLDAQLIDVQPRVDAHLSAAGATVQVVFDLAMAAEHAFYITVASVAAVTITGRLRLPIRIRNVK